VPADESVSISSVLVSQPLFPDKFPGPGLHIAERSLAVAIMRILWACDVKLKPKYRGGGKIDPKTYAGFMPGNPGEEMPVCLVGRSPERIADVEREWERERLNQA